MVFDAWLREISASFATLERIKGVAGSVPMVGNIIALIDAPYQRLAFMKRMRMTKQEVKDEYKQQEGDPILKARMRSLQRDRARALGIEHQPYGIRTRLGGRQCVFYAGNATDLAAND